MHTFPEVECSMIDFQNLLAQESMAHHESSWYHAAAVVQEMHVVLDVHDYLHQCLAGV